MKRFAVLCVAAALCIAPIEARAWGSSGHRIINFVAIETLPQELPPFLSTREATAEIEALGPEMDTLKGAGASWDRDEDPAHYVDVGDDGLVAGVVSLNALPNDMEAYEKALAGASNDPYRSGYLPYAIADGWEQLRKDFAYWRAFDYLEKHATDTRARESFAFDRDLRERLTLRDIGVWAHFVGDGSQPLHVTIHYNDGGLHAPFEGAFVRDHVTAGAVAKLVAPSTVHAAAHAVSQRELLDDVGRYLSATNARVPQIYDIARRQGFAQATPEAVAFATARVADGARELRDLIVQAWDNSTFESVGYPEMRVDAILNGTISPQPRDFGSD